MDYARFLDAAHQRLGGPLVVVWDNLNAHVSAAMAKLAATRDWLTICRLPAHAHELNPVKRVWPALKRPMANLAKRDLGQLTALAGPGSDGCNTGPASSRVPRRHGLDLTPFGSPHHRKSLADSPL
jgi:hypothetical protein